ncbi:hypothetical protein F5B21DRAFT_225086 [Xylaria acuta]|nr:hypothetical protein F5B21DRAFT_225086 [Xylaria acuta]
MAPIQLQVFDFNHKPLSGPEVFLDFPGLFISYVATTQDGPITKWFRCGDDPNAPSKHRMSRLGVTFDYGVRRIILVYNSNKLIISMMKELFPEVITSTVACANLRTNGL